MRIMERGWCRDHRVSVGYEAMTTHGRIADAGMQIKCICITLCMNAKVQSLACTKIRLYSYRAALLVHKDNHTSVINQSLNANGADTGG